MHFQRLNQLIDVFATVWYTFQSVHHYGWEVVRQNLVFLFLLNVKVNPDPSNHHRYDVLNGQLPQVFSTLHSPAELLSVKSKGFVLLFLVVAVNMLQSSPMVMTFLFYHGFDNCPHRPTQALGKIVAFPSE
jgi:hypothetical protein